LLVVLFSVSDVIVDNYVNIFGEEKAFRERAFESLSWFMLSGFRIGSSWSE